jgi:tetratricopeptide (TPR) repeat protein
MKEASRLVGIHCCLKEANVQLLVTNCRRQVLLIGLSIALSASAGAQNSQLGNVKFENSGDARAQASFLRGLAALHSFWFEEALDAFRESTKIDPDFMMGYWGEAMAYNHPLWSEQDTAAGRVVVAKFRETPKLTAREKDYLDAVRLLYGEGDKHARDISYSAAMEKIYRAYPNDLDASAFYALSLLGIVRPEEKSYRLQARAGAIALEVYQKNPNHPGAAHYIIHAFDDPEHAILALPAARRYAEIAPEAHHARHMPAHIFLQLGMWPEAAASNEAAWDASSAWVKRKNLSITKRDYHSLHWLLYVYLQQGRYHKAEELVTLMKQTMAESTYDDKLRPGYYENNYANMAAAFVVETERWELADKLFPAASVDQVAGEATALSGHSGHGASAPASGDGLMTVRASNRSQTLPIFVRSLAATMRGAARENSLTSLTGTAAGMPGIRELEIVALAAAMKRDYEQAIKTMKLATSMEEAMAAPSGPPGLIKPSHELYGEILLRAGKPREAMEQFKIALLRQPNRARSLLGLARASAKSGDPAGASAAYESFLKQWEQADEGLAELREARYYFKQAKQ